MVEAAALPDVQLHDCIEEEALVVLLLKIYLLLMQVRHDDELRRQIPVPQIFRDEAKAARLHRVQQRVSLDHAALSQSEDVVVLDE